MIDNNELKNKIQKFEWVSFDIFDTLIKRSVPLPSDVFRIVEVTYKKKYPMCEGICNYYNKRKAC